MNKSYKAASKDTFEHAVSRLLYWDKHWCIRINSYSEYKQVALFFKVISRLGDGYFWYAMLLLPILIEGSAAILPMASVLITSLVGVAIYKALKHKTVRPRPYQVHQVIRLGERPLDHFSFPSGHTLHAVLFTVMIGTMYSYLLFIMVPFMLLVALSRMVLGLHYPTDVMVGALIGSGLAFTTLSLMGL